MATERTKETLRKHLSVTDGFVLYTSAVLGQSLIVLPSIAARHAGPWSILVWAALAAVSYPLARIMAELGARYPSAGGVIAFIGHGLGQRIGWLTGTLYLTAIAVGGPATALIFAEYVGKLVPLPATVELRRRGGAAGRARAGQLLRRLADHAPPALGLLRLPGRHHGHDAAGAAARHPARLTDVSGYDLAGVASTALDLLLRLRRLGERRLLRRGVRRSAHAGQGAGAGRRRGGRALRAAGRHRRRRPEPVGDRDQRRLAGGPGAPLLGRDRHDGRRESSRWSLMLLFMFTWARSATRLIYALAREGCSRLAGAHGHRDRLAAPRRARAGVAWGVALAVQFLLGIPIETYIQLSSGNFLLTYVLIVLTAWRLLSVRRWLAALVISSLAILAARRGGIPEPLVRAGDYGDFRRDDGATAGAREVRRRTARGSPGRGIAGTGSTTFQR